MMGASVYLNGRLVGFHQNPADLVQAVRQKRRMGDFPHNMSVSYYDDLNEVYVNADENRATRPLIIVEKGKSKLTPEQVKLLKENKLKFSDLEHYRGERGRRGNKLPRGFQKVDGMQVESKAKK